MIVFMLRDLLFQHKMNQRELAIKTGIRPATIFDMYHGKSRQIPIDVIDKICKVLDCQPNDIIKYVSDEDSNQEKKKNDSEF